LRLVETGVDGASRSVDVMVIDRPGDLGDIAALGLTLSQGKQLVALVQQAIVTTQSRDHAVRRPLCRSCEAACQVKDYRPHQIATLFGQVTLRLPRFRCAGCGGAEAAGQHTAARRPNSTRSGRSFPPACRTALPPAYSNTFCRSMPGWTPRPCAPARSRSARTCGTPLRLIPMPESSDLSLMTDRVGKGWFSMLCHGSELIGSGITARTGDQVRG
jgi:hypothetical protein